MKVLLCGATGFIGSNILRQLSPNKNYKFKAVGFNRKIENNLNCEEAYCDLRDPLFVQEITKDIDTVLQFAATTSGSRDIVNTPSLHVTDNAVMNSYLLKYASENGVKKFVFPSCTVMYQSSETPLKETDFNPSEELFHNYFGVGNTKLYVEKIRNIINEFSNFYLIMEKLEEKYKEYLSNF